MLAAAPRGVMVRMWVLWPRHTPLDVLQAVSMRSHRAWCQCGLFAHGMVIKRRELHMLVRGHQHSITAAFEFNPEVGVVPCVVIVLLNELFADCAVMS